MTKLAVVALGGNAFTAEDQAGAYDEQFANAQVMADIVVGMVAAGWRVLIVHGNGPQVGNLAIQQEEGAAHVPAQPLFSLGAMTQGQLGDIIARAVSHAGGAHRAPVAIVTHVVVDADDPAMSDPTKPIGPFFGEDEARTLAAERGWTVRPDSGRGHRRVVASPIPRGIVEIAPIRTLLDAGHLVIAAGGGGIPVTLDAAGAMTCVDAVIDKDYAAAEMARALGADALVIVTGVDQVQLDFRTPRQRAISRMTLDEAERHLADGQFPPGSMGPKVRAAGSFLRAGGSVAIITSPALASAALASTGAAEPVGTHIVPAFAAVGERSQP